MTDHSRLRAQEKEDLHALRKWYNDLEIMKGTTLDIIPYPIIGLEKLFVARLKEPGQRMTIQDDQGKPIGEVCLFDLDDRNRSAQLSIIIGEKNSWGKSIGKTAMKEFIDMIFDLMPTERLHARVPAFNEGGIALLRSLGFFHEGTEKKALYRNGEYHDVLCFALLREEVGKDA